MAKTAIGSTFSFLIVINSDSIFIYNDTSKEKISNEGLAIEGTKNKIIFLL